ncbi:LOW QUALITY PROTEIN: THO complex subunit 5 homolog [Dreissena polymorpha]|uniref:LOW QUALITY PROTEIN: THO complex subunit 5 homolog n=1 Tax=Dreissena polymorpha TaxID=45954 RepID=UPI0022643FDF|nr:LOW QUALITY PROTEIN: THO complex subunit 5 homolog [Dreissena polymorpha]
MYVISHESSSVGGGRALFYAEEEEVEQRDVDKDVSVFQSACEDITRTIREIKALKESKDKNVKAEIEQKKVEGMLQMVMLKKLNRLAHIRCKKVRDKTTEVKSMIDKSHLQVQNLLYEILHLEKEIVKCLSFRSKDEEIDLVPVEQFYEEAPPDISKPEETQSDAHRQRLARLDWEREQRQQLASQLKTAQKTKEDMESDNKLKQEQLENLQPKLNTILQSTKPVQEYLNMPFDAVREEHAIAAYLPHPLFVLYMQTCAYRDVADTKLLVSLEGDLEKAKALDPSTTIIIDEDSDSEQEELEDPDQKNKKRSRRKTVEVMKSDRTSKVLMKHPLKVMVKVPCDDECSLQLTFNYLVFLKVVTVEVKVITANNTQTVCISGSDLLLPDQILKDLYPGDRGDVSPNHSNQFELTRLGLQDFSVYVSELGQPYQWAQKMAGLQFLPGQVPATPQADISRQTMQATIGRIRRRVQSRLSLLKQLTALEHGSISVSSEYQKLFPVKLSSCLKSWVRSTYSEFVESPFTQPLVDMGIAGEEDLYFKASIERGSAKLVALVVVGADYPTQAPLFSVSVDWATCRHARNDNHIQELEEEVNIHYDELVSGKSCDQLLTNQLQRLLMCFDVYLETESLNRISEGPAEIAKEKVFSRVSRGRQRSKPYKFDGNTGIFSHR